MHETFPFHVTDEHPLCEVTKGNRSASLIFVTSVIPRRESYNSRVIHIEAFLALNANLPCGS